MWLRTVFSLDCEGLSLAVLMHLGSFIYTHVLAVMLTISCCTFTRGQMLSWALYDVGSFDPHTNTTVVRSLHSADTDTETRGHSQHGTELDADPGRPDDGACTLTRGCMRWTFGEWFTAGSLRERKP